MSAGPETSKRTLLLKTRLGLGAVVLGSGTLLTAAILYLGMQTVATRLETALASETRMARYAALSTQAATFLVIATESVQTGQPAEIRAERLEPVQAQIGATFSQLHADVEDAVTAAQKFGLDEQSRYGTQSLGLARMEALLGNTLDGLADTNADQARLRAYIDSFASGFDPLLSQAVNTEILFRNSILAGIEQTRRILTWIALGLALIAVLSTTWFYYGLVRPQFARLDRLRAAALQIGQAQFSVLLPVTRNDEIGQLYRETNRMATALNQRQAKVEAEWARLNDTIAKRTEELRAANKSLSEIDKNRRRFFADISHELRTPLTIITMESQIGQQDSQSAPDALSTIEASAAKLNQRIDDLLRVARSETGELALEPRLVALTDLLQIIAQDIQPEINSANMQLTVDKALDCRVNCDPNWIRQVLLSLIRNAIRYARDGQKVAVSTVLEEQVVAISLTDNGPGIPDDSQGRIFERFVQGGTANSQGFGVGLALARWVIEAHEGTVSLTSPVPQDRALGSSPGTNVCIRLPVAGA
ncbi:HAMP domain-containing histidine kinase [Rhodobacteraceae bacterium B1Z28]|uniref:histidine kinase n=1 Tax=Ruegeria haliotis TaxID=2747601 RepID=A0ABX2PT38_9RHOB|nr:HAMP domain-containing sensor histidine kinase [Ruegeria haliotis]NVO56722.1 HAMP domain-containing histidine kinase [Ruegeria haliotis]